MSWEKNKLPCTINGMLLYAATEQHNNLDDEYEMDGNTITVRTLNLNCDWEELCAQLRNIINNIL